VNFMPAEEAMFGSGVWEEALRRAPPGLVLVVPKDVSEYGRGQFGEGYAQSLAAWVRSEYAPSTALRVENVPFEIVILAPRAAQDTGDAGAPSAIP
jgi:hypothetical protein